MRGARLNCRFAVNGIQKFDRLASLIVVLIEKSLLK